MDLNNLLSKYEQKKSELPTNEINYEIGLIAKIINRPYGMVAGITRSWSLTELRDSRIQAEKANCSADKAWWGIRKNKQKKI